MVCGMRLWYICHIPTVPSYRDTNKRSISSIKGASTGELTQIQSVTHRMTDV